MKKITLIIKSTIMLFVIAGCMKSGKVDYNYDSININSESFDFIGLEHNNGLDYVFSNVIENNNNPAFGDFLNSVDKYVYEVSPITKNSRDNRNDLFNSQTRELIKSSVKSKSVIIDRAALMKKLTPAQFSMIEKLDQAFLLPNIETQLNEIKFLKT